ncbi:MAG: chromate efflux transporter [Paracoccus sp. (in: a-proteobacteria)]|nr:chromate efflux transporter [Paracoccus sp. (in: a-proteobacteria)]
MSAGENGALRDAAAPQGDWREVARVFGVLGLTSFGGPVAHIGYYREAIVLREKWVSDARFAELLALCQFLPGPASSQLGFALGYQRAGWAGAFAAAVCFTLPSALALFLLAALWGAAPPDTGLVGGVVTGLKITAVAVVAHAVLGMARSLAPEGARAGIALGALAALALLPAGAFAQVAVIALGAALGAGLRLAPEPASAAAAAPERLITPPRRTGLILLAIFAALLILLPLLASAGGIIAQLASTAYRAGALVFGGGHVVLPLLEAGTVGEGLVGPGSFLAGYGAAQAMPGPLFTFATYLGQVAAGPFGAVIATLAIFAPGYLLLMGALPFWAEIAAAPLARHAMAGANAAVVGILGAALYHPIFTAGILAPSHFALAVALFLMLTLWKRPALQVVLAGAAGGAVLSLLA